MFPAGLCLPRLPNWTGWPRPQVRLWGAGRSFPACPVPGVWAPMPGTHFHQGASPRVPGCVGAKHRSWQMLSKLSCP